MGIKYGIDYQHLAKGAARPTDDGEVVGIQATDEQGVVVLPNVGDYVHIDNSTGGGSSFDGRVRSRLFRYIRAGDDIFCQVNIVVEEVDSSDKVWGELIKE